MKVFISGTDTSVGKTVISAWLCHHLNASYWKPIHCGNMHNPDSSIIKKLTNFDKKYIYPEAYIFKYPVYPYLAAKLENVTVDRSKFILPKTDKHMFIEGCGGAYVPIWKDFIVMDLIKQLDVPTILVSRSTLGTINHTCLTLEAFRSRGIKVLGVVMNGPQSDENKEAIEVYGKTKVLAELEPVYPLTYKSIAAKPLPDCIREMFEKEELPQAM
jgi:dethiobiotin synthase